MRSGVARSEYWKLFGDRLSVEVADSQVKVEGESGFYVPPAASALSRLASRFGRALRRPSKAVSGLGRQIRSRFELPRMMPYAEAFDAVMSRAEISAPVMSAFLIDHAGLVRRPQVLSDASAVKRHYESWSGYEASPNIINHYYYQNVLCGFMDPREIGTVLEIGAGNGNFPSILYHDWAPLRVVLIDLPETLAVSIPYLGSLFPEARMALPHEIEVQGFPREFDFAFLTVDQLRLLPDDSVDLAVNCHSFQEMTHAQIDIYFDLIQACLLGRRVVRFLRQQNREDYRRMRLRTRPCSATRRIAWPTIPGEPVIRCWRTRFRV